MILKLSNKNNNFDKVLQNASDMAVQVIPKLDRPHSEIFVACLLKHGKSVGWDTFCNEIIEFIFSEKLGISVKKIIHTEELVNQYFAQNQIKNLNEDV